MRQACACKRKQNENSEREECFDNWGVISWKSLFYIGPSLVKRPNVWLFVPFS